MSSLSTGEQEETFVVRYEQPSGNVRESESFDGLVKSIQPIHSASSSITSTPLPNQQREPYRSSTSHDVLSSVQLSSHQTRFTNSNAHENRLLKLKDYDSKRFQPIIDIKNTELKKLKHYYETRLHELEYNNQQLEIHAGQINEENKRMKIELELEKQQNKIEQTSLQQHLKDLKSHLERKINDMKVAHENDKQEMKQQHARVHKDLVDDTNQRLKKMENAYKYQQSTNESVLDEMEKRMMDLRTNVEHLQHVKQKFEEDKMKLIKTNEQLQLQIQELMNKQRYSEREHVDKTQRYENEIKSINLRCESTVDLLRQENEILKNRSTKTIEELEKKLADITEQFHQIEKSFEHKLHEKDLMYHNHINDYEKQLKIFKEDNHNYFKLIQQHEKKEAELRQQKLQMKINLENQMQEMNENEQILINKLKLQYEQANQQHQETLHGNFRIELEDSKRKYEKIISKNEEKYQNDLQKLNQQLIEAQRSHEIEKQQIINEYEQFVGKLEKGYRQNNDDYEKRIEALITKTHEQVKNMEEDFEVRLAAQQLVINDQKKIIQAFNEEGNQAKLIYEKKCRVLNEQSLREKKELKAQFDSCIKSLEKNFNILASKKEQLERKITQVKEQHQHELIECRLSYENKLKNLLPNDVRLDFENTIHSLRQQIIYLQQRATVLQQELEQSTKSHDHKHLAP